MMKWTYLLWPLVWVGSALAADSPAGKELVLWQKLETEVRAVDARLDGVLGVAIEDLTTGRTLLVLPDEIFPQASSIKIAVLAELYHQDQIGRLRLADPYVFAAKDLVADSAIMAGLTPGVTRITNRDLATMMVAVSDNSATNVLIDRLGMRQVNELLAGLGLKHVRLQRKMMDLKAAGEGRENLATPREMLLLLDALYRDKVLDRGHTEQFFQLLATRKDSWIPRELPEDLRIANKPGALAGVRNDSGVVFASRPYIICVMTTFLTHERDGEEAIGRISGAAYRMFERLGRASEYGRVISAANGSR